MPAVPPEVVMEIPEERIQNAKIAEEEEPKSKVVGIQTDYRESATQTDPYSPVCVIENSGQPPEVYSIFHLKFGSGLPASMAEMEVIENMREKRYFDDALPPTSDEACFILRRKLMNDQEYRQLKNREEEIKRVQNEKLNLLQSALIEREKVNEERNAKRIDNIRLQKTENKERIVAKI